MRMITFTILALMLLFIIVFSVLVISLTGAVGIVLCSDIIVCAAIIYFIIKKFVLKK